MAVLNSRLAVMCLLMAVAAPLPAQVPDTIAAPDSAAAVVSTDTILPYPPRRPTLREELPDFSTLTLLGAVEEDRLRLAQILGRESTDGFLIRSPSSRTQTLPGRADSLRWTLILPATRSVRNSTLPLSLNEGAMWASRGWNLEVTTGMRAEYGRVSLILAPHLGFSENNDYQTVPALNWDRNFLSSLWHHGLLESESADLPQRFGRGGFFYFSPGQSTLDVEAGRVVVGASTENQWWGPGIRNAIVMSNNAPGIPHLFLSTAAPIQTRIGDFEGRWMVGRLAESEFFDTIAANDVRSISALAATFRPAGEPNLTLGFTRAVYASVDGTAAVPLRALDVVTRSGRFRDREGPDQLFSLFARWIFPDDGVEVYAEWARNELPLSVRDFLTYPNHSQGYTLGLQWARPLQENSLLRLHTELTNLEWSPTYRQRPVSSYYTSRSVPHGYTHRGQVIGAAIGPGGSSQWLAADYLRPTWGVGLFAGRIRWENDEYYWHALDGRNFTAHDVSMLWGGRGQLRLRGLDIGVELVMQNRMNFLFQNWTYSPGATLAVDKRNTTLRLVVTPTRGW